MFLSLWNKTNIFIISWIHKYFACSLVNDLPLMWQRLTCVFNVTKAKIHPNQNPYFRMNSWKEKAEEYDKGLWLHYGLFHRQFLSCKQCCPSTLKKECSWALTWALFWIIGWLNLPMLRYTTFLLEPICWDCTMQAVTAIRSFEWFGLEEKLITWQANLLPSAGTSSNKPRFLQALAMDTSRDGAATISLGNLCQTIISSHCAINPALYHVEPSSLVQSLQVLIQSPSPALLQPL